MPEVTMVSVGELKLPEDNVRTELGDVAELATSIKHAGILEPLLVRDDKLVVCGSRRLVAARKAGLKEVPVIVRPFSEIERVEAMVIENVQRESLSPLEEAGGFLRLVDLKLTQTQIAERVGRSQAHVSKRLGLLKLPEKVQESVRSGGIALDVAVELGKITDPKMAEQVAKKAEKEPTYASQTVQKAVDQQKKERAFKEAEAKLASKEKNVVTIKTDAFGYAVSLPEGMMLVEPGTQALNRVDMKVADHRKLDCHAVAVNPQDLSTLEVCTKATNHPTKQQRMKAETDKAQAEAKKKREEWNKASERRHEFLRETVGTKIVPNDVIEACRVVMLYAWGGADDGEFACELLFTKEDLEAVPEEWDALDLLEKRAERSQAESARVTFAIALASLEATVVSGGLGLGASRDTAVPYYALLKRRGFKPTPVEKLPAPPKKASQNAK